MRDLATQHFSSNSSSKIKIPRNVVKAIVFLVLIIAVVAFTKNKLFEGSGSGSRSVTLRDAPGGLVPVSVDQNFDTKGVILKSDGATLRVVKGGIKASAQATRSYGDGTFGLTVEATLPDPHANSYQVWLLDDDGSPHDAGFMNGAGTSWSLNLRDADKYSKYTGIWITYELTKEDNKPEEHILEGSF